MSADHPAAIAASLASDNFASRNLRGGLSQMIPAAEGYRLQRLLAALPMLGDDGNWLADLIRSQIVNVPDHSVSLSVRAQLIQDLAAFHSGRPSRQAKDMAQDARRYAAVCWPRDKREKTPPAHHRGKREAVLFELHRNAESGGARWPLAWRSLTDILQSTAVATATDAAPSSGSGPPAYRRQSRP